MGKAVLCLCLTGRTIQENLNTLNDFKGTYDLAELRADFLLPSEWQYLKAFPLKAPCPVIMTIRKPGDGGLFAHPEEDRLKIFRGVTGGGYAFFDFEEDFANNDLEAGARADGARIIRSIHSVSGFPSGLETRIRRLKRHPTDLPKAAIQIQSAGELLELLRTARRLQGFEKILLGMGPIGFITRVLASKIGSFLSYSSPPEQSAAPGRTDPLTLQKIYRYRQIGPDTKIFGIIGNPVMHSFSPRIHNAGFERLGLDAVYLPMQIEDPGPFFSLAEELGIEGVSVTIPFKESVIPLLNKQSENVTATGACNTLTKKNSSWQGTNTDVQGFLTPLEERFLSDWQGERTATVIGAGGAARSIVYALRRESFHVLILNRTPERAKSLAESFGCEWDTLDSGGAKKARRYNRLVVQTTSVGMVPDVEGEPFGEYRFQGSEIVYDIVYNPSETSFLRRAMRSGCRLVYGREMLLAQALHQFKLFTGRDLPEPESIDLGF
ncbi:MAG TPA: shikimate dehydrogenase [Spirochaetia bacterium]|nr:shikimate dehydrogenase [Spirochaetia bacterium]